MAVSCLIQGRSGLRFNRYGFPNPVRWLSLHSSDAEIEMEKAAQSKKRDVPKAERAVAADSFVKGSMEENSGVFPKVSLIQNQVGGSWNTIKGIVTNIRATMADTFHPENFHNINASTPAEHSAVSKVMATPYEPDNEADPCGHHESSFEAERVQRGENKEDDIEVSSGTAVECLSNLIVDPVSSDVTYTLSSSSGYDKLDFSGTLGQQGTSTTSRPAERVQQGEDKEENTELPTGRAVDCLSSLTVDRVPSGVTKAHCPSSSLNHDKLNFTGSLGQRETSTTCRSSPNSSVKMSSKFGIPSDPHGLTGVATYFKFADRVMVPDANSKNEESPSGIFSGLRVDKNPQSRNSRDRSFLSPGIPKEANFFTKRPDLHADMSLTSSWEKHPESFTGSKNLTVLEGTEQLNTNSSESVRGKNGEDISKLMDCIKWNLGGSPTAMDKNIIAFTNTDGSYEKGQLEGKTKSTSHISNKKHRNLSAEYPAIHIKSNHDGSSMVLTTDLRTQVAKTSSQKSDKAAGHSQLKVPTDKEESHETLQAVSIREDAEHKAILKFLPRATTFEQLYHSFKNCGSILKVKFTSPKGRIFRDAVVYFKKQKGLRKALIETDVVLRGVNITVKAADGEDILSRISIPRIISDPDVPVAMVKNPTRTVKIEQLTREISLHDVVEALESLGSNVSGFFVGTLDSVVYIEFEEEDDKEAILARHSIDVLGKRLFASRIDAPRTTCVRISFHKSALVNDVVKVYTSLGEPMLSRKRHPYILDVQYKIAEWPNMLKILNSLNRTKVNGHKLQAQPATIIPPPILEILWRNPEERIHIKNCVQKLLRNLGKNIVHKADLADLPNFY